MASTTNYGWTTPDDTGLVKDGASAIRSLGTAIDTTVYSNANAAIAKTLIDAKGDLIVGSAADTVARLAVGSDNQVLVADSTATNGVKWGSAGGGQTLISTTTLPTNATTVTINSIPSTYKHLLVLLDDYVPASGSDINMRFNSDTGNNYQYFFFMTYGNLSMTAAAENNTSRVQFSFTATSGTLSSGKGVTNIYDYTSSSPKKVVFSGTGIGASDLYFRTGQGAWSGTSAISSMTIYTQNNVNFNSGTIKLYGVN